MRDLSYPLSAFIVMAAATFPSRLFPFLTPKKFRDSRRLRFIGDNLPASVMLLLVAYCLKGTSLTVAPYGLNELLCVGVVAGLHVWRRNGLLSIGVGTGLYILLVRL